MVHRGGPSGTGSLAPVKRRRVSVADLVARSVAHTATRTARATQRPTPQTRATVQRQAREPLPRSYNPRVARQVTQTQRERAPLQHRGREPLDSSFNAHVAREVSRERSRRAAKSIQTRFPTQQRVTGGTGPVGTPGGPRRLAPGFAPSPFGRRFLHALGQNYQSQASGPGGVSRVGPLLLPTASQDSRSFGVSALEQTTRPIHAIAGGVLAAQQGRNVFSGIGRGFENKDRYLFSDVLRQAGVKGPAASILGATLDVGVDPTTYLSFGASSVPKALGARAARKVTAEATRTAKAAGATEAEAAHAAQVARSLALKDVRANRGLTVGLRAAGREVRTSGRATAKLARTIGVPRGTRVLRDTKPVQVAGQLLRPEFRPKGVPEAAWQRVRRAERTSRAMRQAGARRAQDRAVAFHRGLKGHDQQRIIDAIEAPHGDLHQANEDFWQALKDAAAARRAGNSVAESEALARGLHAEQRFKAATSHLSDPEQVVANALRRELGTAHQQERAAKLVGEPLPNYFPHKLAGKLLPGGRKLAAGKRARLESSKERKLRDTISNLKAQGFDEFSTDIPLVLGARLTQSSHALANAHLISELSATGRRFGPRVHPVEGEAVYEVTARDVPRKLSNAEIGDMRAAIREHGPRDALQGRDIRVLNQQLVDRVTAVHVPKEGALRDFGRWFDRSLQGKFKTLVTVPNPQYHLTNLYGDAFNAYLADSRLLTSTNTVHSARALRRLAKREAARRTVAGTLDPSNKGLRIRGKKVTYDTLIAEAERVGAVRTGFIGRDLPEVLDAMSKEAAEKVGQGRVARRLHAGRFAASKGGRLVTHPIDAMRNAGQYREDFIRLATYIEGRKRGLTPAEAADRVAKHHFDYGDLTDFERTVLRRVFPFYTFTARNTPLQVSKFLTRPGKYATLQKVREEGAKAEGLPAGYEGNLTPYQARQQPIPLPFAIPGVTGGSQNLLNAKLPATDIGRLAPDLKEQLQYVTGMTTPFLRTPLEFGLNYSTFFRGPIDALYEKSGGAVQDYAPAPQWLGEAVKAVGGEGALRAIGLRKAPARQGGPRVWVWPKRVNYLYGNLGPAASVAQRVGNPAENQAGQGSSERLFNFLTGLNVYPYDAAKTKTDAAYKERDRLDALAQLYRRDGRDRDRQGNIRPPYRKLLDRLNKLNKRLTAPTTGGNDNPLGFPSGPAKGNPLGF